MLCAILLLLVLNVFSNEAQLVNLQKNSCSKLIDYPIKAISSNCFINKNVNSNIVTMTANNGYQAITYNVTTADGYILTNYRITKPGTNSSQNKPILLMHGILTDGSVWVDIGPRSLAFFLLELGYDIWIGNLRGTTYSRGHVNLTYTDSKYWDFNLDTMAKYDISTIVNLVANETGKSLTYIGHSMGTTLGFMYASSQVQEANQNLEAFVALSPIVYFGPNIALNLILRSLPFIGDVLNIFGVRELLLHIEAVRALFQAISTILPFATRELLNILSGTTHQFWAGDLITYFSYYPSTTSVGQLVQYGQMYYANKFQYYKYSESKNIELYNQTTPPEYNLQAVTLPVLMYYGRNDAFISEQSVTKAYAALGSSNKQLQAIPINNTNPIDQIGHIDFEMALNITTLFYDDFIPALNSVYPSG